MSFSNVCFADLRPELEEIERRGLTLPREVAARLLDLYRASRDVEQPELKTRGWYEWLRERFPMYRRIPFAQRHIELWDWVWRIERENTVEPLVAIWPRGGAKSTSGEHAACVFENRKTRRYLLYVCETQQQADGHVANIAAALEELNVGRGFNKYGHSRGWRRNRLVTDSGFVVDALGLDVGARGIKFEDQRPDVMIFDDVDNSEDSPKSIKKKRRLIANTLLPAGSSNCVVLFLQNLIHNNSLASMLVEGRADFLLDRKVSGPHPAVEGLKIEERFDEKEGKTMPTIVAGVATWAGQSLEACQNLLRRLGVRAFREECQHEVNEREGALWSKDLLTRCRAPRPERFKRVVVAVDPSGGGDDVGIIVLGLGYDEKVYVLADLTCSAKLGPSFWSKRVCRAYSEWEADCVVAESNFGGDLVKANIKVSDESVAVRMVHASRGKDVRAEPVVTLYEDEEMFHCGEFVDLETEQTSWEPGASWSPNRLDACVWGATELKLKKRTKTDAHSTTGREMFGQRIS